MRVMSASAGYRYLLNSVVSGDGARDTTEPLTRYYAEKGTPPGRWLGSGLPGLGDGSLRPDDTVTETQLQLLLGKACDPLTGAPLGRAWARYPSVQDRIDRRLAALPLGLEPEEQQAEAEHIREQEKARPTRQPVAGFDHTFSVPKSVSALWAVADGGTQDLIARAHHAAVAEVIDLFERDVAMTRIGASAGDGAVAQVEVRGVVATGYDHYDSRSGDPQLHTHVVIANRVQAVHDGRWLTLDGRPVHAAVVALSEHYNAVLADHLSRGLSLSWAWRDRGERRNPGYEIEGVPEELLVAFSSRSRDIDAEAARLIADYTDRHDREPSARTVIRLRAEATLRTRPDKTLHSLAELTDTWRTRATDVLGKDAPGWATDLIRESGAPPLLRADDIPLELVDKLACAVLQEVGERRSTWRRWNLYSEAARQLVDIRFASTSDREAVTGLVVDTAEHASVRLTPPELARTPVAFQRPDGSSVFRPKHGAVFSSQAMLDAEDRLLALTACSDAPAVDVTLVDRALRRRTPSGHRLSTDQAAAITRIAVSGRALDVLIGPAGTGKTTTLSALRAAWERQHGKGSVVGLAPSAPAAAVLADELKITTENTAKWLYEHDNDRWNFTAGQLVLIDEASLAGTMTLDRIAAHARDVGAKVLLVGDPAQLDAVDAGGALSLVATALGPDAGRLTEVRRFAAEWERTASLRLRVGDADVIDTYDAHDRLVAGTGDDMLAAAYAAWLADTSAGKASLMIAETSEAVAGLNTRARLDRVRAGIVAPTGTVALHDGTEASAGDIVMTRRNDRRLRTSARGWVRNRDLWRVQRSHGDGSLTVTRHGRWGSAIRLPADYVSQHVELGYAVTAHRAQGATVDTAHAVVHSAQMTRESLYVALTRGRHSNIAYVAIDQAHLEEHQQQPDVEVTAATVLRGVLAHVGAEPSAHEIIRAEQEASSSIAQLAAEYDTLAEAAQHDRWIGLFQSSELSAERIDQLVEEESLPALAAELRRAEANHHDLDRLLPAVVAAGPLDGAADIGAVLMARIQRAIAAAPTAGGGGRTPRLIAGLIPRAEGITDPDIARALTEREKLIEQRAHTLAQTAVRDREPWAVAVGVAPGGRAQRAWLRHVAVIAAYRDRYRITTGAPLGAEAEGTAQRVDHARAAAALTRARALARAAETRDAPRATRASGRTL